MVSAFELATRRPVQPAEDQKLLALSRPEPEKVRPVFRQLRELKTQCENVLGAPMQHLSMGMSGDFEIAIEEGATIVRIGTALFGPRSAPKK